LNVDARFPGGACGLGIRRTALHGLMVQRAASLGVNLWWKTVVTGISGGVQLGSDIVRARWIIGADGAGSRVRRWAGLDVRRKRGARFAFRRHYRIAPWADRVEVHWDKHCQVYVTPVSSEQIGLALLSRDPQFRIEEALQRFPELRSRLAAADEITEERGASTANSGLPRVYRKNVVLVGDASGTVDAISGEGLSLSFRQATELASGLAQGGALAAYQQQHRRMALRPRTMARLLLALDGRPKLQRKVFQVFCSRPEIFQRLLALHVGAVSPLHLAVDGLTLGWDLLTA
jgi:flavin-dependent dehydrogenase